MIKNKLLRWILIIVGFISLGLGTIGIILPILPTAPFFLVTSFCFVKSSKKFNQWFLNTKLYQKYLMNFEKNKIMTLKSEIILLVGVSAILLTSMFLINNLAMTIVFSILITIKVLYFSCKIRPVTKEEFLILNKKLIKEGC